MNWRNELATLRDHFVLPWMLILLPWRWAWGALWWLTRYANAYDAHGLRSRAGASPVLGTSADAGFARRAQFVRMLDIIDAPLSLFRSDRHLQRWWNVEGAWPKDSACLAISLHYGNGLWALRHLQLNGHRTHLIAQRIDPAWFTWRPVTRAVMAFREWRVVRLMETPIIHSGGARARSLDALRNGRSIVAVLDNPQGLDRGVVPVQMFGRRLALHTGILHLGLEAGVPVVPYLTSIEANGRRRLRIGPAIRETDVAAICTQLEAWFQPLIAADPAGWHLWPHIREFEDAVARYHPAAVDNTASPTTEKL
jgi:phosphatidylinositol dimannoside acyltransferase